MRRRRSGGRKFWGFLCLGGGYRHSPPRSGGVFFPSKPRKKKLWNIFFPFLKFSDWVILREWSSFFLSFEENNNKIARREAAGENFGVFFVWEGVFATPRREAAEFFFPQNRGKKTMEYFFPFVKILKTNTAIYRNYQLPSFTIPSYYLLLG